ncbi:O-antigen ligase family protein [Pseudidiomarina salilacus]|uniref:O-antigen ligase family protein n=1 Tax=Pseudidiomarina salilacus TaxID=3384452 RepID=UPI0039852DC8
MQNLLIALICAVVLFLQPLFFSFLGLLGVEYSGDESRFVYIAYVVTFALLSSLAYIYASLRKGILRGEIWLLGFLLFLFILHLAWIVFEPVHTPVFPRFLVFFLLFGLPGFLSAATIVKLQLVPSLVKVTELLIVLIALGLIQYSVLPSLTGTRVANLAGASYQQLSYYSAFVFGLLLAYNFHLSKELRFSWTSLIGYRIFSYALLVGSAVACFIGGGRGAFLLLLTYLVIALLFLFFDKNNVLRKSGLRDTVLKVGVISLIAFVFIAVFWDNPFIQSGFNRATQFVSAEAGLDLQRGSSGRDVVYRIALEWIEQRPLLGYGPFSYFDRTIQAHNMFLDVWLQFGLLGLIAFIVFGIGLVLKAMRAWNAASYWLMSLLLYPLVMLMVSNSYMHSAIFIFGVSYVVMVRRSHL